MAFHLGHRNTVAPQALDCWDSYPQLLGGFRRRMRNLIVKWKHGKLTDMSAAVIPSARSIRDFCESRGIAKLRLFGSAAREDFDIATSDVDLLVEYERGRHPGLDHFLVAEELSELFGRKVDLNTPAMLGCHLRDVIAEAQLLYGKA